jgi:phospholipid/cholesterol/gamma-HCH transport system substrate-binding protein
VRRAIREHLRDFIAMAVLLVLALVTGAVILVQQQATLPSWVPVIGSDRFELKAELTSAQAVTPGQGQTVNIAGIKVGSISEVELSGGAAVVTMQIENEYAPLIYRDASLLLRPRTGLQDMTLELDPGSGRRQIAEGSTVALAGTQPNVQPDEILATLDGDTRAYLQLLLNAGAEGLGGRGEELSEGLRRFEPTARDLARIGGALAVRRQNLERVVTNFRVLSEELGRRDTQLAGFIDSSSSVLGSFARQEASIRSTLRELPGALRETQGALASGDRLALTLGPAARRLIPAARALEPALRETRPFFRETLAPIREQIRPFARAAQTPLKHVKQGAGPLGETTKGLAGGFGDLNRLLNALAYNPPGAEEGFLFWAGWLNHDTNAVFFTQDAGGPLRHGMVLQSCQTAQLAEGVALSYPFLRTLQQLSNVPTQAEITANGGC